MSSRDDGAVSDDSEAGDEDLNDSMRRSFGSSHWFTPVRLLRLFCAMSILVYVDRGMISSAAVSGTPRTSDDPHGSGLQGALDVSYAQYGALTAAFMVGLLFGSPTYSALATRVNPFKLISYGLGLYALAEVGCAIAPSYWFMFACRCLVGIGEASFVSLAAPFIDDYAPPARKTLWLATFYLCVPFGVAFGIFCGGAIAPLLGWRSVFGINAAFVLPIAAFCFTSPPVRMRGVSDDENLSASMQRARGNETIFAKFLRDCKELMKFDVYVTTVLGYAVYTAVIGVYAVWGPKAGYAIFKGRLHTSTNADMVLGGVTVLSGIFGTLIGGVVVDKFGSTMTNALRISSGAALIGFVCLELAFRCSSFHMFIFFLVIGQMFAFVLQAPINAVVLWSVKPGLRPLACSMTTVTIHLLGDVPTPPLFGHFLEMNGAPTPERWRHVCASFTFLFILSSAILALSSHRAKNAPDHRRVGSAHGDEPDDSRDDVGDSLLPT